MEFYASVVLRVSLKTYIQTSETQNWKPIPSANLTDNTFL